MPKKEMDYSKTIIYKIVCNDLNITECYVGHTTNFVQRKNFHKTSCNNQKTHNSNYKIYQTIRDDGGWDNWSMIEVEKYPCNDINEATARERHWYEQLNSKLNSRYPGRTKKEYNAEYNKKIIHIFTCECGSKCNIFKKSRHFNTQKHKDFMALKTDTTV